MPVSSRLCPPHPDSFLLRCWYVGSHYIPADSITWNFRQLDLFYDFNHGWISALLDVDLKYFQECITCDTQKVVTATVHQCPGNVIYGFGLLDWVYCQFLELFLLRWFVEQDKWYCWSCFELLLFFLLWCFHTNQNTFEWFLKTLASHSNDGLIHFHLIFTPR